MTDTRFAALGRAFAEALIHYAHDRDEISRKAISSLEKDMCDELNAERNGQKQPPTNTPAALYKRGDPVIKDTGNYKFAGRIAFLGTKLNSGALYYAVENDDGVLLIMNEKQLKADKTEQSNESG